MIRSSVFFECLPSFFNCISIDITNITEIRFILNQCIFNFSLESKRVDHNTRNNITEQKTEKDKIDTLI